MHYAFPFLPLEVQTSIKEIVALGTVPESAIDLLIARFAKALEDKTTSLQMDLARIETSFEQRYDLIESKLIADNQTRTGNLYEMIGEVRTAQMAAHPEITQALRGLTDLTKAVQDIDIWQGRLKEAFEAGRDHAADERSRLWQAVDLLNERLLIVEQILEITPEAHPSGGGDG